MRSIATRAGVVAVLAGVTIFTPRAATACGNGMTCATFCGWGTCTAEAAKEVCDSVGCTAWSYCVSAGDQGCGNADFAITCGGDPE